MRGFGTDGSEDRPVAVVVDHLDHFIGGRTPDGGIGGAVFAINRLGLPVVVVVVRHQFEGLAAVSAMGIGILHGKLRAVQHAQAEDRLRIGLDGAEEADAHFGDIFRFRNFPSRAGINVGMNVVEVVRRREFGVRAQVRRLARIRRNSAIPRRSRRMRAALARSLARDRRRACSLVCVLARILRNSICPRACGPHEGRSQQPSFAHENYSLLFAPLSVRNIAMASISISSSGRHRCA